MNDQMPGTTPWNQPGAFNPSPVSAADAPVREPRQKRKARTEVVMQPRKSGKSRQIGKEPALGASYGKEIPAPAPKKPRKAKKPKVEKTPNMTIKVGLKEYAVMRVGDDSKLFLKLHGLLSPVNKAVRAKLLAELSKVLG